jgi:hypothetical protein
MRGNAAAAAISPEPAAVSTAITLSDSSFVEQIRNAVVLLQAFLGVVGKEIQDFFTFGSREVTPVNNKVDSSLTPLAKSDPNNPHLMGMWCPPRTDLMPDFAAADKLFKDVAAAGFNNMWYWYPGAEKAQILLDAAQANGLKVIMTVPGGQDFDKNNPEDSGFITRFKDHPALYGFAIMDEPSSAIFGKLASVKAQLKELMGSTNKPVIVNLFPIQAANSAMGYSEDMGRNAAYYAYTRDFCSTFKPEILCYDHYPLNEDTITSPYAFEDDMMTWFKNISDIRLKAWSANAPMWIFIQAVKWGDKANPTLEQQRFLLNLALVFGAKNTQYFFYQTPYSENSQGEGFVKYPVDFNGNKTADYYKVQQVNAEFKNYLDIYAGFNSKGVILHNPSPGMKLTVAKEITLPNDFAGIKSVKAYDGAANDKTLIIGGFENDAKTLKGLYVFNYDFKNETNAKITFGGQKQIEVYGAGGLEQIFTGSSVDMTLSAGGAKFIVLG